MNLLLAESPFEIFIKVRLNKFVVYIYKERSMASAATAENDN